MPRCPESSCWHPCLCAHLSTRHPLLEVSSPINLSFLATGIVCAGVKPFCFLESTRAPDLCPHFPRAGAGPADGSAAGFCTRAGVQGSFLPKSHFENKPQQLHSVSPDPRTFQWSGPHPRPRQGRREPCGDPLLMAEAGSCRQHKLSSAPQTRRPLRHLPAKHRA